MAYIEGKSWITRKQAQELLGVGQTQTGRILKSMVNDGLIVQVGGSRSTRYELVAGE